MAYLRLSPGERADPRNGLDAQRADIRRCLEREGYVLVGEYVDEDVSGAVEVADRPAFLDAVAALPAGGVLLVQRRDRFGRDVYVACVAQRLVERAGGKVVSATEEATNGGDPTAALFRGLLDLLAQHERAVISARTSKALNAKVARGEKVGAPGLGERAVRDPATGAVVRFEADPGELLVVRRIVELADQGLSRSAIARRLEEEGMRTKRGGRWTHVQVGAVLRREARRTGA